MYPHRAYGTSLHQFFAGLTEQTFEGRLGIADPPVIDYVAALLARFVRCESIFAVRHPTGKRLDEVVAMIVEADHRSGDARREVHRHIGDFTLFWSGVYPEALRRLQSADRRDHLIDYQTEGKRAYYIASTIRNDENAQESEVLERLSHEFEMYVYGLGEVRREWERQAGESVESLGRLWIDHGDRTV
jgi:hypothetical protein